MLSPFFVSKAGSTVKNFTEASAADTKRFAQFFHAMLDHGIYLPPSQFESWFISLAHTSRHIDTTIQAATEAMKAIKK
jgi:glutamate-1-semialdehyde 2,1-aminomutase